MNRTTSTNFAYTEDIVTSLFGSRWDFKGEALG